MYIAENLKAMRKGKDLTQEEVAEFLGLSPQSVSKWERGDTYPDITLLPALANLYKISVDTLIGMDKINDRQTRNGIFASAHNYWRSGEIAKAIHIFSEGLKTYPNDEGIMSELAMALAQSEDSDDLAKSVKLCEHVLSNGHNEKVFHTTRAALCFIYMKSGEKEKAAALAKKLPHIRESRENVLAQLDKDPTSDEINSYLRFIAIGENNEQNIIEIDFGLEMIKICSEQDLLGRIKTLRDEFNAPQTKEGLRRLPLIQIRDKSELAPAQVRVRQYADYLLDKEYENPADAVNDIIEVIQKIIKG
ncbi:MAG: helix-turn-helix domain-containing protein [Oscillospiraceae bacterium]|jgi:transcriptional regulator with XRE-family HTH domain|nr:helix-turn-helix domain-containing protein [Oscillospiraceae bacterium]